MNIAASQIHCRKGKKNQRSLHAFSLPEITMSMALFVLLLGGVVTVNLFGVRWYMMIQTKLVIADKARAAFGRMSDEIRTCAVTYVGTVSNGLFTAHAPGEYLTGNGLMIYTSTNSTNYILYFYNSADQTFRCTSSQLGTTTIEASSVTNNTVFQAQDWLGNVLTNSQGNYVISARLNFFVNNPASPVPFCYTLQTAVNPRAVD